MTKVYKGALVKHCRRVMLVLWRVPQYDLTWQTCLLMPRLNSILNSITKRRKNPAMLKHKALARTAREQRVFGGKTAGKSGQVMKVLIIQWTVPACDQNAEHCPSLWILLMPMVWILSPDLLCGGYKICLCAGTFQHEVTTPGPVMSIP